MEDLNEADLIYKTDFFSQDYSEDGDGSLLDAQKVIVFMSSLLTLFSICRVPSCGSFVEKDNMRIVRNGAMIRIHTTCNNHHVQVWDSSPSLGTGRQAIAVINILIAVYSLLTGLHIKQVVHGISFDVSKFEKMDQFLL